MHKNYILNSILVTLLFFGCGNNTDEQQTSIDNPEQEWQRTNPDIQVYLPTGNYDGDNEHFLVFESPTGKELLAMWTQSSVEGHGDNRIRLARSDDVVNWSDPGIVAGTRPGQDNPQASWGFPLVSDAGRIYCFYTKEVEKVDKKQHGGLMGCYYSDDNGHSWTEGADIPMPKNQYDHPNPDYPKNWIVWQKPVRDGAGHWIAGYTQWSSKEVVPPPSKNWPDSDSRSAFVRFVNINSGPDPKDLVLEWYPVDQVGLEVPHKLYPEISVCQEPSLVLLPDGRLFTTMRTMTGFIWYSVSDDKGKTWRQPEVLRYKDDGEKVKQPMAPCPIYALENGKYLLVFHNNEGQRGEYNQFKKKWDVNQANYIRNPAFIAVGEFRENAHQPIWFSQAKEILDTQDIIYGPKKTAEVATYTSVTEWGGQRVLWYPDRKHFLLGKYIPDAMLADMTVAK